MLDLLQLTLVDWHQSRKAKGILNQRHLTSREYVCIQAIVPPKQTLVYHDCIMASFSVWSYNTTTPQNWPRVCTGIFCTKKSVHSRILKSCHCWLVYAYPFIVFKQFVPPFYLPASFLFILYCEWDWEGGKGFIFELWRRIFLWLWTPMHNFILSCCSAYLDHVLVVWQGKRPNRREYR